jgi:hypothetical protein
MGCGEIRQQRGELNFVPVRIICFGKPELKGFYAWWYKNG